MSGNRFDYCLTGKEVLDEYRKRMDANPATRDDAIARIAELTPRTVDEAARERAHDYFDTLVVPAARNDDDHGIGLDGRCDTCERPEPATPAEPEVRDRAISGAWLSGLMSWNIDTFGPGLRTEGVTDHIARELDEIRKAPTDLTEWADVILLALAGAVRAAGAEGEHPRRVIDAVLDKHQRNLQRKWPDWRTAERGKAIEHVRDTEPADAPHQCADVADDCCERTPPASPAVELDAETGIWSAPTSDEAVKRFTEAWPHAATSSGRESLTEALQHRIKELLLDARISSEELTAVLGAHVYGDRGPFTNDPARFSVCSRAAEDLVTRYRVLRIGGDQ